MTGPQLSAPQLQAPSGRVPPIEGHASPPRGGSFANAAMRSMLWLLGQSMASRAVQAIAQIVLAWFLLPAQFGQISIALTIVNIVEIGLRLGLDDVVLHRSRTMQVWFGTVFWLSLFTAGIAMLLLLAIAPVAAQLYHQPNLVGLISILALSLPIRSLATVPFAILRARLNFRLMSVLGFLDILTASVLSIGLAYGGFGAFSFVLPSPIVAVIFTAVAWVVSGSRLPRRRARFRWRALLPNSLAVTFSRLLTALVGQGDYIVLGLVATETRVGLYFFAYRIAGQPMRLLASSITGVLFPTLVRFGDDIARQRNAVVQASQVLAIVVMPVCFLQAALAEPFLALFFQHYWADAAFYIKLLSIGLAFDAVSWTVGALLPASGQFNLALRYIAATTAIFFVFIIAGALIDADYGVPVAVSAYYVLIQPGYCYLVLRRSGPFSLMQLLRIYAAPVLLGALTAFGSLWLLAGWASPLMQLVLVPVLALPLYALGIWHLAPAPCRYIVSRIAALRHQG